MRSDDLRRILALLKATFSHQIIDLSKGFGPLDMSAMEVSDKILLVTQLDLTCLRNVVRVMQFLDQHEGLDRKVEIIVNRMGLEDSDISLNKSARNNRARSVLATAERLRDDGGFTQQRDSAIAFCSEGSPDTQHLRPHATAKHERRGTGGAEGNRKEEGRTVQSVQQVAPCSSLSAMNARQASAFSPTKSDVGFSLLLGRYEFPAVNWELPGPNRSCFQGSDGGSCPPIDRKHGLRSNSWRSTTGLPHPPV